MIRKFPDSAPLIVKKLAERLQDVSNDSQYITTICLMVQHNSLSMLEFKVSFTMLLYSMEYRGLVSAKRLYTGISPLFRSSGALRDSAFLVLRKLLHSCLEEVRQVAVVGFLEILKNFRFYVPTIGSSLSQTSMSSQATVDVHHSQTSNSNRAFCSELLKLLQCALSQQASVRLTLYQNLPEVVSRNPELLPECIKMLRCHLKIFIDPEAVVQVEGWAQFPRDRTIRTPYSSHTPEHFAKWQNKLLCERRYRSQKRRSSRSRSSANKKSSHKNGRIIS